MHADGDREEVLLGLPRLHGREVEEQVLVLVQHEFVEELGAQLDAGLLVQRGELGGRDAQGGVHEQVVEEVRRVDVDVGGVGSGGRPQERVGQRLPADRQRELG